MAPETEERTAGTTDRRNIEVRLTVVCQLHGTPDPADSGHRRDLLVACAADATVAEVASMLVSAVCPGSIGKPSLTLYQHLLRASIDDGSTVLRGDELDPEARFADFGLVDGRTVLLRQSSGPGARAQEWSAESLVLIDERGTHLGRRTALTPGLPVSIGALSGDAHLVVDDLLLGESTILLTCDGAAVRVETDAGSPFEVRVSGAPAPLGSDVVLSPGATLSINRPGEKEARLSFRLATQDAVVASSDVGKVGYNPSAREGTAGYRKLLDRYSRIDRRPDPGRPPTLQYETLLASGITAVGFALITGNTYLLFIAPVGAIPMFFQYVRARKHYEEDTHKQHSYWLAGVKSAMAELSTLAGEEERNRNEEAPSSNWWALQGYRRLAGLWSRSHDDVDFLRLRVGTGEFPSRYKVELAVGVDVGEQVLLNEIRSMGRIVRNESVQPLLYKSPVTIDLMTHHVGVVGPAGDLRAAANDLLIQLACAHSPGAVSMLALLPAQGQANTDFKWLRWLPHLTSPTPLAPVNRFASGRTEANRALAEVVQLLRQRPLDEKETPKQHLVLVVHESTEVDQLLLAEVLELTGKAGHLVWIGTGRERIAQQVTAWVEIDTSASPGARGKVGTLARAGERRSGRERWPIGLARYERDPLDIATQLAPLYDPRVVGANAAIPNVVALTDIVDVEHADWSHSAVNSLWVPMGSGAGSVQGIDLHRDGPHVLIGGTTGSGKSELLQSLVSSISLRYAPSEVSLFLVDFKGGSTFGDFADLPHVVGYVDDLDGENTRRSLAFLQAEIRRRIKLFRDAQNAKEYADYRRTTQRTGASLPRMVVVFDEFATLVQDYGDFALPAIIDIAQRGRSYGIHLVLATQRPSSDVVGGKVRANVRARIALQTLSAEDSAAIIETSEAYQIPRSLRGRAFLRLEGTGLLEFQTAHAGALHRPSDTSARVLVRDLDRRPGRGDGSRKDDEDQSESSFEYQVGITSCVRRHRVFQGARPDVRLLSEPLSAEPVRLRPRDGASTARLQIGLRDLPDEQKQLPLEVDLGAGALLLRGPARSGKTESLLAVAEAWAELTRGQVVVLDASGALVDKAAGRGHGWYVVNVADSPATTRLIDQLHAMVTSLAEKSTERSILMVIDGLEGLISSLDGTVRADIWLQRLRELVRFGRNYGVFVAMSASAAGYAQIFESDVSQQIELWENYERDGVARADRLPGFGLTADGELVQLYALEPAMRFTGDDARWLDLWTRPPRDAASSEGFVVGSAELTSGLVVTDLELKSMVVVSDSRGLRDRCLAAYLPQISTLPVRTVYGLQRASGPLGSLPSWPVEELLEARNRLHHDLDAFEAVLSQCEVPDAGPPARDVLIVRDLGLLDDSSRDTVLHLALSGRLWLVLAGRANDLRSWTYSLSLAEADYLFLEPDVRLEISQAQTLLGVDLVHRPRGRYAPGQGVLVREEEQIRVWTPGSET